MKLVKASYKILTDLNREKILKSIERAGRTCYKSEDKITEGSASKFVKMVIERGHESVLEHESISVKFIIDRGVSHELVRHRLCAFSQESTRYCNYSKDKHGGQLTFILPTWIKDVEAPSIYDIGVGFDKTVGMYSGLSHETKEWVNALLVAESTYLDLLSHGWTPQQARSVLPNALKTEIVTTANLREWKWIFKKRTPKSAHPQIREVMQPLLGELKKLLPEIFSDIGVS